jgi:hypothetical protein
LKAASEQALAFGWHARNLHYVQKLKPLDRYLMPALPPEQKREQGARDVLAMLRRQAKKKGAKDGTR